MGALIWLFLLSGLLGTIYFIILTLFPLYQPCERTQEVMAQQCSDQQPLSVSADSTSVYALIHFCQLFGCDGETYSRKVEDVCGVCGGDGSTCQIISNTLSGGETRGNQKTGQICVDVSTHGCLEDEFCSLYPPTSDLHQPCFLPDC